MPKKGFIYIPFFTSIILLSFICFHCSTNSKMNALIEINSKLKEMYKDKVVLIVNGDDVGITEIFTDATIDAYLKGGISSASIVATGHDVERAIALLKNHPELPVGVHLTLTGDWKPLTSGASLRNAEGLMWNTSEEAARNVVASEAEIEWDAQIKKIIDAGINVTHIDSHMGCYFLSSTLYAKALGLAKKYRIPMISSFMEGSISQDEKKFFLLSTYTGIYRLENKKETLENRASAYWKMLEGFKPGIHYLYTHQGWEPSDKVITGDLDLRINEYKFWTSEDTKKKLAEKGYIVIGCAPLKEEFQSMLE